MHAARVLHRAWLLRQRVFHQLFECILKGKRAVVELTEKVDLLFRRDAQRAVEPVLGHLTGRIGIPVVETLQPSMHALCANQTAIWSQRASRK